MEKDKYHMISVMWNLKKQNKPTKQNKHKLIDTENRSLVTRGEGGWRWVKWIGGGVLLCGDGW